MYGSDYIKAIAAQRRAEIEEFSVDIPVDEDKVKADLEEKKRERAQAIKEATNVKMSALLESFKVIPVKSGNPYRGTGGRFAKKTTTIKKKVVAKKKVVKKPLPKKAVPPPAPVYPPIPNGIAVRQGSNGWEVVRSSDNRVLMTDPTEAGARSWAPIGADWLPGGKNYTPPTPVAPPPPPAPVAPKPTGPAYTPLPKWQEPNLTGLGLDQMKAVINATVSNNKAIAGNWIATTDVWYDAILKVNPFDPAIDQYLKHDYPDALNHKYASLPYTRSGGVWLN